MDKIVEAFRALIGIALIGGALIILFTMINLTKEQGFGAALVAGFAAGATMILTVGIAATLILATDYLKEIRDELRAISHSDGSLSSKVSLSSSPSTTSETRAIGGLASNNVPGSSRKKIKTYKGHVIERGEDGAIYVGEKRFKGLLSAEKHVDSL